MNSTPSINLSNMKSKLFLESCIFTRTGHNKDSNEDTILDMGNHGIFGVADGIGGPVGGREASRLVMSSIWERCENLSFDNEIKVMAAINEAIVRAKVKIQQFARAEGLEGVGTTIAILRLNLDNNSAYIVHAGDSRVYRLRDGKVAQLTCDHKEDQGPDTDNNNKNSNNQNSRLTRAIGLSERINLETTTIELQENDVFCVSSAGLHNHLKHAEISKTLYEASAQGIKYVASELARKTKQLKVPDDVSIILVKVKGETQQKQVGGRKPFNMKLGIAAIVVLLSFVLWLGLSRHGANFFPNQTSDRGVTEVKQSTQEKVAKDGNSREAALKRPVAAKKTVNTNKKIVADKAEVDLSMSGMNNAKADQASEHSSDTAVAVTANARPKNLTDTEVVETPVEPITTEPTIAQTFMSAIKQTGLIHALKEFLPSWESLTQDEKRKLNVLVLKEINNLCRSSIEDSYENRGEIRKTFEASMVVNDSSLNRAVGQRRKIYEAKFLAFLESKVNQARDSCDWEEVRSILVGNQIRSDMRLDSELVIYAHTWCKLTNASVKRKQDLDEYFAQLSDVATRIHPLVAANGDSGLDIEQITKTENLSSLEYCKKLSFFSGKVRDNLVNVTNRLVLNISIVTPGDLERMINSTHQGKDTLAERMDRLNLFKTTAKELNRIQVSLTQNEEWTLPEIEFVEFGNWSSELVRLSANVYNHLKFMLLAMEDYEQNIEQTDRTPLDDVNLITDYKNELEGVQSTFSFELAESFAARFKKAFSQD